jgi:hypothetical protein
LSILNALAILNLAWLLCYLFQRAFSLHSSCFQMFMAFSSSRWNITVLATLTWLVKLRYIINMFVLIPNSCSVCANSSFEVLHFPCHSASVLVVLLTFFFFTNPRCPCVPSNTHSMSVSSHQLIHTMPVPSRWW